MTMADASPRGAADVVAGDLAHILDAAGAELSELAGARLLVTGGAGFLGYYLVQAALHWNGNASPGEPAAMPTDLVAVAAGDDGEDPPPIAGTAPRLRTARPPTIAVAPPAPRRRAG